MQSRIFALPSSTLRITGNQSSRASDQRPKDGNIRELPRTTKSESEIRATKNALRWEAMAAKWCADHLGQGFEKSETHWAPHVEAMRQVLAAVGDFCRNYDDMLTTNQERTNAGLTNVGVDKYFHCKANCEAAEEGVFGALTAIEISTAREVSDIFRDKKSEGYEKQFEYSKDDMKANSKGWSAGVSGARCSEACGSKRP